MVRCCRVALTISGFLAVVLTAVPAWAAVYFVNPTGRDTNPGSEAMPWRTLARGAATLVAGDTLTVGAGIYQERLVPARSGKAGLPITFAAASPGTVVLDGEGIALPDDLAGLLQIDQRSHIIVSGFYVMNAGSYRDDAAIMVLQSSDIEIRACTTENSASSGIGVWASQRITIEGCHVEHAASGVYQESITIAGTDGFVVRGCTVRDCLKEGICLKDGSSHGTACGNDVSGAFSEGIYIDAWDKYTHDIEVFANLVHDNK
jgi:hypothetical protein